MSFDGHPDVCPFHPSPPDEGLSNESDDRLGEVSSILVEPPVSPPSSPQPSEEGLSSWYQTSLTSSFDSLPDLGDNDDESNDSSILSGLTPSESNTSVRPENPPDPLLLSAVLPEGQRQATSIISPLHPLPLFTDYREQGVTVRLSRRVVASHLFERLSAEDPPAVLITPLFHPFGRANIHTRFAIRSVSSFRGGNGDLRTLWDEVVEDMAAQTAVLLGQSMEVVFHRRA